MAVFTEGLFDDPMTQDDIEPTGAARRGAIVNEAWSSMVGPSLYRMGELNEARRWGGMAFQEYDPDQAREWIKGQGLEGHLTPESRTYNQLELSILARRKKAELQRQYVLERAGGGFARGSERLLLSLGTSLADPLTVASAFVPVVGEARYARLLQQAGTSALSRAGVRAGLGAIEGAAGAALVEPIVYAAKAQEQADYDLYDSMANIAFGGIFGGGLHSVGGAVLDYRTGMREAKVKGAIDELRTTLAKINETAKVAEPVPGTTPRTLARAAGDTVPDAYFERATALAAEMRKIQSIDMQKPAAVSAFVGRKVQSLAQFIKESGGINDIGGELSARDVTNARLPGLVRRDNMGAASVDAVRQRVFDEGYFPGKRDYNEISDSELFDAIADDMFQSKRYPLDVEEALMTLREGESYLDSLRAYGIEPGMKPTEIAARLREMEDTVAAADTLDAADWAEYQKQMAATKADEASHETREAALKEMVARDLDGERGNVEPLFELDAATRTRPLNETLEALRRGEPRPAQAVDELVEAADEAEITQQVADLEQSLKDLEREMTLDESTLPEDMRAEIDAAREMEKGANTYAETARMLTACAMRAGA